MRWLAVIALEVVLDNELPVGVYRKSFAMRHAGVGDAMHAQIGSKARDDVVEARCGLVGKAHENQSLDDPEAARLESVVRRGRKSSAILGAVLRLPSAHMSNRDSGTSIAGVVACWLQQHTAAAVTANVVVGMNRVPSFPDEDDRFTGEFEQQVVALGSGSAKRGPP